jgi:PAS domain S-box-containing protein
MTLERGQHDTDQPSLPGLAAPPSTASRPPAPSSGDRGDTPAAQLTRRLHASEDRFQALAAATGQIVWTARADGSMDDMPGWCAYTGQPAEEARGGGWLTAVHPADRERVAQCWAGALAALASYATSYRLRRHDGLYQRFRARAVPVFEDDGAIREWVGVITEIGEEMGERPQRAEPPERSAQESLPGAGTVDTPDEEHAAPPTERQARELDRRTRDALDALLAMAEALVTTSPSAEADGPGASESEAAEGTAPAAHAVAQRLAELAGSVLGAERLAMASVEVATDLMRPLAVIGFTPEQEAIWWAGWRPETRVRDRLGLEIAARLCAGETVALDAEAPLHRERLSVFAVTRLLLIPMIVHGQIVGALSLDYGTRGRELSRDEQAMGEAVAQLAGLVVERDRLLREAAEARASALALSTTNRRMDEFLSIAAHELRTPVTVIKANTQMLARRLTTDADTGGTVERRDREMAERIQRQVERLIRLVDDLVDISRIRLGRLELRPIPADLGTITREAVAEQRLAHPGRVIALATDAGTLPIEADVDRIEQVIANYLTNALKYSRPECPVTVTVRAEAGRGVVAVRDCGVGIPPEEQASVWELFHRVQGIEVQSGSGVGLGLGLHLSRTIVERHGGAVGLESAPGEGSTFWFALPLVGL